LDCGPAAISTAHDALQQKQKFGSSAANFLVERFVADRSALLTLPSNHSLPVDRRGVARRRFAMPRAPRRSRRKSAVVAIAISAARQRE
jgi:hypothetical protein